MRASLTPHSLHRLLPTPIAPLHPSVASLQHVQAVLDTPFTVPVLHTPAREFRPAYTSARRANESSSDAHGVCGHDSVIDVVEVRPIRTMQDLHTMLLGFAHAAATSVTSSRASLPHKPPSKVRSSLSSSSAAAAAAAPERHGEVVLHSTLLRNPSSQPSTVMTTPRVSRPNSFAAPNSEHHFLHRLLLHRRERRRRERQTVGENSTSSSGTPSTATRVATPTSTTTTGALWYRAFELFSEAVQQHHVSPTAQHLNLLLYIAQRHALWGQVDVVEEFWARLLSSVQRLRQEKMRDKRRVEQKESKYGEEVKKHGMAPLPETLSSTAALAHAQTVFTVPPFPKATSLSSTTRAALMRQLDELGEMEQALMPNAQTYELLLGSALVRGAWSRALEYCDMRTRSGLSTMTDASVRQVLQVYILAEASGAVIHSCTSFMVGSPPNLLLHRLGTGERGQGLRGLAAHAQSSKTTTARSGSAQDPSWLAALQFFRNSVHRVSSMHTVWSMATLLNCASQWAELVRVVRDDCQQLVQTSLRSLAAHALTSVERAALLRTLKMVSDAACDLGDWRTALQVLREVAELRRQLLPEHSAWLEQLWGLPHRSGESDVTSPAVAAGNSSSDSPSLLLTQPIMEYFASPDQMNTRIINDDVLLDEVRLSQHLLKNALLTLRRVRRYAQMIELYGATSGVPGVAVNGSAGTERAAEQDDSTLVWRSMWTPSAVGYVAQAALAVQDLDLLLGLCGLTADGETMVTEGARASLGIPAEVYDATLHLIQYHIIRLRCEAKKSMRNSSTAATAAAKGRGGLHWDVLSQRVYKTYRQRALQALAEEASPYRAYLERTTSEGDGHTVVVRNANVLAALAELDAPLLSSTHKPLVQLLAQSLQGGVDAPPVNATLQQQMLEHLQRIRCPDTLVIALAMDIVRTQARQRRFSDREAQTLLVGIQQVLNTVLVEQHMEPIQLVSTSPCDSVTRWVVGSGSAQRRQSSGHHRRLSGPASLAASSPGGANWVSELTPTHLLSLSTLTAAAAHMSLDALACVQPLTLLTYIPACVELAWLPSTAAPAQLQRAQQAAVQRADEELQKDAIVFTEHHPTTTDQITRSNGAVLGCAGGTADLRHTAVDASPFSIEAHGKSAVAHFVSLYTEFSSRKTNAVAASSHAVLDAAAQVLMQLQRSRACHPPTAAMSAFIEALRHAWSEKTSLVHGPPPRVTSLMLNAEVERVVVASLNAVVQQVGASTVSRWTMWGDCVDMLMTYIGPPFSAKRRQEAPTERTEATPETLRVLHMFIRLCDRAETDFVERVTMDWLLHSAATTRSSRTGGGGGGGGCAQGEHIAHSASKHSETAVDTVEQLRSLCLKAQEQFCCASSVPHEPFSSQEWESMQLLIGALVWACRRQAKSLVRRLYSTLVPWLDVVLWGAALPSSPSPPNCIQSVTVNAVPGVAEKAVLHQQLSSLCETALAACTTVAQCLSSGPRVEVLQDWPLQLRALRQLTDQGNSAAPLSHFSNRRKLAALVDSIAAVVVKLRRTWCYLLNELALDSHRLVSEAHQRRGASPTSPPLQPPASVLKRRRNIEDSAASFAEWSCAELLPRLVLSCLRACVEHEALSDTTPTTTPPTRGHFPSPRALVTAALHKILEAVWDVDFAAFVWQVKFRVREGTDDDGMRAQKLARLRARGYHALSIELAWLNGDSASQELVRHLYMWILFTLHSVSTTVAVTELCRDLVSLDAFHGIQLSSTTPRPFLLLFVQEVDMLTEAKVTEALASAYCTGSTAGARAAAAAAAASDASSSPVAALARMKDGRTAMEHLTNPLVHFTLSTLRAAQQAAQWVLYLILCEGTVDLQAAGNTTDAAQKPMGGDCAAMSHAAIPCARLLHRCLAWSGQTHVYPALLRVVEVAAHETLRGPEAVVSVFHHMERLGRAEEGVDEAAKDGETVPDTSSLRLSGTRPLDAFLAFYMHSTTMRRASPVSEQVCLAAVLACAAHTRTADAAAWLPPADLLTLLTAFPQVVSNHLITKWIQNRLSQHQTAVLTEWMLRFFWGGVVASSMDSSTACLKRYGVGAAAAADGDITTTTTVTLPLRRASMQWLLVTRGTTAPPPPQDEGGEAWNPSASNEAPSSSQPSATAVERIASLATMLGRSNEFFAVRVGGVVVSSTAAAAPPGDNSVSPFPEERPLDEQQQRHPGPRPPCALAVLTRDVLQNVSTRNAVQQLLNRYQCTNSTQRRPTRVEDTETDALVRVLPEDAQRSAKSTLQYRDDPAVSPEGDLASEASPRMAKSHAQPPVPTFPAASNEKAVALERWLDLTLARLTSETADLAPPPTPLPWVLRCPEQEEGLTWNALHTQLLSIIKNMYHDSKDGPHAAAQVSSSQHNLDTYTQRRATTLRSTLLRVLSRSPKQEKNPLTSPGIEKDVSVCVSSLLLLGYVLLPLQSLRPPPSMVEVSAVVRRELWRLLLPMVCNGASVSSACASSASRQRSRSFYSALVQFCVRPLVLDALPQPCLSTLATNQARTAAFEAAAYLVLLVHHMSTAIHCTQVFFFGTLTNTAASSASRNKLAGDATTVDALSNTARELHRLSERELYHLLQTSSASTLSLQEPPRMVYGLLVRAWMQAGVLLGDVRSLLWGGQRLATWSLQRRQEATALAWIAEGSAAVSGSTARLRSAAETDALAEWLCVLPVAVLVAEVCGVTRGGHTGLSEALYSLAAVLPLPSSFSSAPAASSHGASVAVARDGYVNLLLHWRQQLQQQNRETGTSSGHLGGLRQKRLSSPSPFAVILHGSVPANTTQALVDSVRRRVREYLAGSTISYPLEQQQQVTPLSCNITPTLRCGGEGGCIGSRGIITAAALSEAFQCVRNASEADMRAFMRLEAAKRTPASKDVRRGAPKKAMVVQAMWSLINRAALQRRQGCGAGSRDTASWVSFVPPETWQSYVLNLHPVVPHTVHFIPAAVTEVLMLESCITWTDGLAVLEHSLGTLHHTGATPVQQYMAQLLLERVRRTQQSPERPKAVDEREEEHHFCAKLETYTYTALQQQQQQQLAGGEGAAFPHWHLWSQHMARRSTRSTAALVCRIVDLLLMHHVQTTRTTTRGSNTRLSSVLAKHTLMEALRCGVHDPALTRALFGIFWVEQYPRVEGVHVFLSALRAAKLARSDALALEAMLTYLWISDQNVDTTQRREEWTSHVLRAIDECETRATVAGPHISSSLPSSGASAWQHLKVAARKAAELQGPSHRFSVEAHRATWKSWTVLCRLRVVPKDVALCVVGLFKQLDRITEVEELMMLRCAYRRLGSTNRYTDGSGRALDSGSVPRDLHVQAISNRAYPVQGENWQPVIAGKPAPHKGNVIISGAGVVGLTMAAQFSLRGWHATVVERSPPLQRLRHEPMPTEAAARNAPTGAADPSLSASPPSVSPPLQPYRDPLVRPHFGDASAHSSSGVVDRDDYDPTPADATSTSTMESLSPSRYTPFIELQYALVTRRALDALEAAGIRLHALRHLGIKVRGVMNHPGAYNSWITAGLTEHHPFAVNMLSMDLFRLRQLLEEHVAHSLPSANLQIFHEHVIEAVYPLRQQLVVRPWETSAMAKQFAESSTSAMALSSTEADRTAQLVAQARLPRRKRYTSLTLSARQWEKKFAADAVDYDLLVSAEGVNSHLRDLVDVEGFLSDVDMGVRWFLLRSDELSHEHVHRWLHRRRTAAITSAHSYHVQSAHQVPLTLAFPRIEGSNLFSVMVYAPQGELVGLDDLEMLRHYLPDLASSSSPVAAELRSFVTDPQPYPTVYCEQLHNTVGLPSAVLVGDAAHTCNPFWMQSLALSLEDGANLLNQVDAYSRHFYDAVKQYSSERGSSGDALRELTDKCLYYERRKHVNPFIRFQNSYQHFMNVCMPRGWNTLYEGSVNHVYSRSIEDMLNSRGYSSYDYAEKQQAKHRLFYHLGRLYT